MAFQSSIYIFSSVVIAILIIYFSVALYSLSERGVEIGPENKIEIVDIPMKPVKVSDHGE
jgi:hypothetical protein